MNLFDPLPEAGAGEVTDVLARVGLARVERVVSLGQTTDWFDQAEAEWVCLLRGAARLEWEGGAQSRLDPGDCVLIPAHRRHRVAWTDPSEPTVWLCVFAGSAQ